RGHVRPGTVGQAFSFDGVAVRGNSTPSPTGELGLGGGAALAASIGPSLYSPPFPVDLGLGGGAAVHAIEVTGQAATWVTSADSLFTFTPSGGTSVGDPSGVTSPLAPGPVRQTLIVGPDFGVGVTPEGSLSTFNPLTGVSSPAFQPTPGQEVN